MYVLQYLHAEPVALAIACGVLGLLVGSFLNVVVYRTPVMMERDWWAQTAELTGDVEAYEHYATRRFDLVAPRSRCPHCARQVSALENIPVLSYLWLGGRCRGCRTRIATRYPVVELMSGVMSAVAAWHFGFGLAALSAMVLGWSLIALALIDFETQLLPDSITLPMLWLGLAVNLGGVFTDITSSVIGAMAGYGVLWTVFQVFRLLTGKEGMGFGDFKLLAMLGAWLGWQSLLLILILSSVVGAVVGGGMIVALGRDRQVPIPFGPFLAAAGWIALLWGGVIMAWYSDLLAPRQRERPPP